LAIFLETKGRCGGRAEKNTLLGKMKLKLNLDKKGGPFLGGREKKGEEREGTTTSSNELGQRQRARIGGKLLL